VDREITNPRATPPCPREHRQWRNFVIGFRRATREREKKRRFCFPGASFPLSPQLCARSQRKEHLINDKHRAHYVTERYASKWPASGEFIPSALNVVAEIILIGPNLAIN